MAPKSRAPAGHPGAAARPDAPVAFEEELRRIFALLCTLADSRDGKLSATEFGEVQRLSTSPPVVSAAGSGAAGAKCQKAVRLSQSTAPGKGSTGLLALLSEADYADVDISGAGSVDISAFIAWQRTVLQSAENRYAARKKLVSDTITELEGLERRRGHIAELQAADMVTSLGRALEGAAPALGRADPAVILHRERLAAMKAPMDVVLSTLAGARHEVQVTRTQCVGELRRVAANLCGKKPYRILLACATSRLHPDDVTLETCGITSPGMDIGIVFTAEDPLMEMPIEDFLGLLVKHDIIYGATEEKLRHRLAEGTLQEVCCVNAFAEELRAALEHDRERQEAQEATKALTAERQAWLHTAEEEEAREAKLKALWPHDEATCSDYSFAPTTLTAYHDEIAHIRDGLASLESKISQLAQRATDIKRDIEADIDRCVPVVCDAFDAVHSICMKDYCELRSLAKPPLPLLHVLKAVWTLLCEPSLLKDCQESTSWFFDQITGGESKPLESFWAVAKRDLFCDRRLFDRLLQFDKDNIHPQKIRSVQDFISNDDLIPERILRFSIAGEALCKWVRAMNVYHHIAKLAAPKKLALQDAQEHLAHAQQVLQGRQARLCNLEADIAELLQHQQA